MPANTSEIDWGPDSLKLNREQIAQVAYNAGFRGQDLVNMVGIAMRESGGHAGLYVNRPRTGDWSYGLWGINIGKNRAYWPTFQKMGFTDPSQLRTPEGNAKAAFAMFKARGLYPWGGYKGKSGTYSTDLKSAAAAVQSAATKGMLGSSTVYSSGMTTPARLALSTSSATSAQPLEYRNWVGSGWGAAAQYKGKGLSPYLQGMMEDFLRRYPDTANWGGYNYRPAKGSPTKPSAHAFGAATDWGYGKDRAAADQVIAQLTSNPSRYGIQQIHDYVNSRTWKVGKGWVAERKGSGGGDMGRPGATWLHLEVSPSRYGSTWGADQTSAPTATGTTAGTTSSRTSATSALALANLFSPASVPRPTPTMGFFDPSVGQTAASSLSGGRIPTASQTLARLVGQRRF